MSSLFRFLYLLSLLRILHVVSGLDIPGHWKGIDDSMDRFNFSLRNTNCKQRCGPQSNMFKTQMLIERRMYQEVRSQKSFSWLFHIFFHHRYSQIVFPHIVARWQHQNGHKRPTRDMISPRWFLTALPWALWARPTTVGTWPCTSSRHPKKVLVLSLLLLDIVYWYCSIKIPMLKLWMPLDAVKAMENVQRDAIVSWIESGERGGCQGNVAWCSLNATMWIMVSTS